MSVVWCATPPLLQAVSLLVIDEIHMLGEDRGPVLEVIVSRTNFISSHTSQKVRVVGLSTALANARDLADWLGISQVGEKGRVGRWECGGLGGDRRREKGGGGVGRRGRGGERRRRNGMTGERRNERIGRKKELEGKRGGEVGMWRQVEWRGRKKVRSRVSLAPLCCSLPPPLSFKAGLFNFRPAVRPVPLETHIQGFPTKQYCPRMATMNKPAYTAICTHSPRKPVLIFVASRRQTRLTAQALIGFLATTESPKQWLHLPEDEVCQ